MFKAILNIPPVCPGDASLKKVASPLNSGMVPLEFSIARDVRSYFMRQVDTFNHLVTRLRDATVKLDISASEFEALPPRERQKYKFQPCFTACSLKGNHRKAEYVKTVSLFVYDLDDISPATLTGLVDWLQRSPLAFLLYSTVSHSPRNPRVRLLFPLAKPLYPAQAKQSSRVFASLLPIPSAAIDVCSFEVSRCFFVPTHVKDVAPIFTHKDGCCIDATALAALIDEAPATSQRAENPTQTRVRPRVSGHAAGASPIARFNNTYTCTQILEEFLTHIYEKAGNKYRYKPSHSAPGASVTPDGRRFFSHHSTDPASSYPRGLDAFGLYALHLYQGDTRAALQSLEIAA